MYIFVFIGIIYLFHISPNRMWIFEGSDSLSFGILRNLGEEVSYISKYMLLKNVYFNKNHAIFLSNAYSNSSLYNKPFVLEISWDISQHLCSPYSLTLFNFLPNFWFQIFFSSLSILSSQNLIYFTIFRFSVSNCILSLEL